jgi:hypothetical protein
MSDLVVLAFDSEDGAEQVRDVLAGMQQRHLITLADAAVVVRKQDGKVKVKQAVSLVGQGAVGGAFWGMLIGIIFWMPWLGMAMGALSGALGGALSDIGVDDKFIKGSGQHYRTRQFSPVPAGLQRRNRQGGGRPEAIQPHGPADLAVYGRRGQATRDVCGGRNRGLVIAPAGPIPQRDMWVRQFLSEGRLDGLPRWRSRATEATSA